MTLDQAIENRELYLKNPRRLKSTEDYNATLLSIEALKREQSNRRLTHPFARKPLPGETEE